MLYLDQRRTRLPEFEIHRYVYMSSISCTSFFHPNSLSPLFPCQYPSAGIAFSTTFSLALILLDTRFKHLYPRCIPFSVSISVCLILHFQVFLSSTSFLRPLPFLNHGLLSFVALPIYPSTTLPFSFFLTVQKRTFKFNILTISSCLSSCLRINRATYNL